MYNIFYICIADSVCATYAFKISIINLYVSYYFLKHNLDIFYSSFIYIYSMLKKPNEQLEDKYIYMEIVDDYILIK